VLRTMRINGRMTRKNDETPWGVFKKGKESVERQNGRVPKGLTPACKGCDISGKRRGKLQKTD